MGGTGQGTQGENVPRPVLLPTDDRLRTGKLAALMAEAVPFPELSPEVMQNLVEVQRNDAIKEVPGETPGFTFCYNAGEHMLLRNVLLHVLGGGDSTELVAEMREDPRQAGVWVAQAKNIQRDQGVLRWAVRADVATLDADGNNVWLDNQAITFTGDALQFNAETPGSRVLYAKASTYQRFGANVTPDGGVQFRVFAAEAARVTLKFFDENGQPVRVPLHPERRPLKPRPIAKKAGLPPPMPEQEPEIWVCSMPADHRANPLERPYVLEVTSGVDGSVRDVLDPYAREIVAAPQISAPQEQVVQAAKVARDDFVWQSDHIEREEDRHAWITYRLQATELTSTDEQNRLQELLSRLDAMHDAGITTLELPPLAARAADGTTLPAASNFAIDPSYGSPADLKALIDAAHARGLNVVLHVVYDADASPGCWWQGDTGEFLRNHALYQLETFHADGLRVTLTGDPMAPANLEAQQQLMCLHAPIELCASESTPLRQLVDTASSGKLPDLQAYLQAVSNPHAADSVDPLHGSGRSDAIADDRGRALARLRVGLKMLQPGGITLLEGDESAVDSPLLKGTPWDSKGGDAPSESTLASVDLTETTFDDATHLQLQRLAQLSEESRTQDAYLAKLPQHERTLLDFLLALFGTPQLSRAIREIQRKQLFEFARAMLQLRRSHRAALRSSATRPVCVHQDRGVMAFLRGDTPGQRLLMVANTSQHDYDGYMIPLPQGRWRPVASSDERRYGGRVKGLSPRGTLVGNGPQPMALPATGFVIFEEVE